MLSDPRDAGAYRVAIASIGLALVIALAGVVVVVGLGEKTTSWTTVTTEEVPRKSKSDPKSSSKKPTSMSKKARLDPVSVVTTHTGSKAQA
ncbi:MAG TPA: hypothetical protein VL972_05390, partial [Solirubrobacteraceae bacterium]|nr:hypothetical protein [Solirubrobacteraceae bacterium]